MQLMATDEWRQVLGKSGAFEKLQLAQGAFDIVIPRPDYVQLLSRTTPGDMEKRFRDAARLGRSA